MKRNPFRKRPLVDFLNWFERVTDPDGDGKYLLIFCIVFLVIMLWLFGDCMKEDGQYNRHIRYNEHTGQYYREITY